jgi:8-oxo-dGTP diphosphatase
MSEFSDSTQLFALLILRQEEKILVIRQKRGANIGKINFPGGKLEIGETSAEAARRECLEETGLEAREVKVVADLWFEDETPIRQHVSVCLGQVGGGQLMATPEADPSWIKASDLPYAEMWAGDRWWIPEVLSGKTGSGWFRYARERLLEYRLNFFPHQ